MKKIDWDEVRHWATCPLAIMIWFGLVLAGIAFVFPEVCE